MSVKPVSMKEMLRDLPDEKIGMYVVKRYNKFIIMYKLQGCMPIITCNILGLKIIEIVLFNSSLI